MVSAIFISFPPYLNHLEVFSFSWFTPLVSYVLDISMISSFIHVHEKV